MAKDSVLTRIFVSDGGRLELIALYLRTDKTGRYGYEYSILSARQGMVMPAYDFYQTEKTAITRAIKEMMPEIKRILGDRNKLTKDFMEWADKQNNTQQSLFNH